MRFKVTTVVFNCSQRGLSKIIEGVCFSRASVLTHRLVEELDYFIQFKLANILQVLLARASH
ncbi:hypothetical protein D3C86_1672430 [compost metagenome]